MIKLSNLQKEYARQMLLCVINGKYKIEYGQLAAKISPDIPLRTVGKDIGEVSKLCAELDLPPLSVIVVSKDTQICGNGFFNLCAELGIDNKYASLNEMYTRILNDVKTSDWYKLVNYLELDMHELTEYEFAESEEMLPEGKAGIKSTVVYERNPYNRKVCIEIHGTSCKICGFDFGRAYGAEMSRKIHVHHIKPLSEIKETHLVNPKTDLIPVCPNCHLVIHSKKDGVYTVEEVKAMLKNKEEILV